MVEHGQSIANYYPPLLEKFGRKEKSIPSVLPTTFMDELTFELTQIPDLFRVMNTGITGTGSMILERSLRQPLMSVELIKAKQDAVSEIVQDPKLKSALQEYLHEASGFEPYFYEYFFNKYKIGTMFQSKYPHNLYDVYKGARNFLAFITEQAKNLSAHSLYFNILTNQLTHLNDGKVYDWIKNPSHLTPVGLRGERIPWFIPKLTFKPTDVKPYRYLILPASSSLMMGALISQLLSNPTPEDKDVFARALISGSGMGFMMNYFMIDMGRDFDWRIFVKPIGNRLFSDLLVLSAVESVGMIDELVMLANYAEKIGGDVCIPEVSDDSPHHFSATKLRNPYLITGNPDYVPNDIHLDGQRLTFFTGPVSGGKTALSKTIAQTQLLAQIGAPIPAEKARISVADQVFYQAPMTQELDDKLGRFATEANRIKDVFYKTTSRSLVIFDELIEATTTEEKLEISYELLDDFSKFGANIVLVTHNHQLVRQFQDENRGKFLKFQFVGTQSTHKLQTGISTESHSREALEKVGFSREDRRKHLKEKGYIQ